MVFVLDVASNFSNSSIVSVVSGSVPADFKTAIVGIVLIILAVLVILKVKDFVINSILGLIALFLLNFVGVGVPINLLSIVISGLLGLAGVALLVILYVFGFVIR